MASNQETFVYIRTTKSDMRAINADTSLDIKFGLHRVGVIMFATVDKVVYVSASLCNPMDRFNKNRAVGLARSRWNTAYHTWHLQLGNTHSLYTVDNANFIRPILEFDIKQILSNLRILVPLNKYYKPMDEDIQELDDIVTHELNDHLEGAKRG